MVFSPRYDISAFGLERLHPFDSRKYGKAWALLERRFGRGLRLRRLKVDREIARDELLSVHTPAYLESLRRADVLARAFEVPQVAKVPVALLDRLVLRPMRWATRGTYLAARRALDSGLAVNLSGGYHHAKKERAEGFTIYSDISIAIRLLLAENRLASGADRRIAIVDLDAHQSNGAKSIFEGDAKVAIFDVYNRHIYPADRFRRDAPNLDLQVSSGIGTADYLELVRRHLPGFLAAADFELAFYVAGTDIYEQDRLGQMRVSFDGIVERDLFVAEQLTSAGIPWVMVLGGGYTEASHRMIAASVGEMLEKWPVV